MKKLGFVVALVLFGGFPAWANDASFSGDGATVYATQENRIRMVREDIRISYSKDDSDPKPWKADCTFEFENLSDQVTRIQMGFPNWKGFGDANVGGRFVIEKFETEIDGRNVSTESKPIDPQRTGAPWKVKGKIATFEGAFVWPVEFQPKQKIKVRNRFAFGGFTSNGPFNVLEHVPATYARIQKKDPFWTARKPRGSDVDFSNAIVGSVAYITTTGQTWNGPIGEANISFEIPPFLQEKPHYMLPYPAGYTMERDRISWSFKNYAPQEEITIYFLYSVIGADPQGKPVGFQYPEQARAWLKFSEKSRVAPEVIDRLIELSDPPAVKKLLQAAKASKTHRP